MWLMTPALIASVLHCSPHHFRLPLFRFAFASLSAQLAATFITPTLTPLLPCFLSSSLLSVFLSLWLPLGPAKCLFILIQLLCFIHVVHRFAKWKKATSDTYSDTYEAATPPSRSVFYLRFSPPPSSCCLPNLLAAGFCHRTTPASQVKRG